MTLPFIVGPHQCLLNQGPNGCPQVDITLRLRLPVAEFIDAPLLSLGEQRPLFQQHSSDFARVEGSPPKSMPLLGACKSEVKTPSKKGGEAPARHSSAAHKPVPTSKGKAPQPPCIQAKQAIDATTIQVQLLSSMLKPAMPKRWVSQPTDKATSKGQGDVDGPTPTKLGNPSSDQLGPSHSTTGNAQPTPSWEDDHSSQSSMQSTEFHPPPRLGAHPQKCPVQ